MAVIPTGPVPLSELLDSLASWGFGYLYGVRNIDPAGVNLRPDPRRWFTFQDYMERFPATLPLNVSCAPVRFGRLIRDVQTGKPYLFARHAPPDFLRRGVPIRIVIDNRPCMLCGQGRDSLQHSERIAGPHLFTPDPWAE